MYQDIQRCLGQRMRGLSGLLQSLICGGHSTSATRVGDDCMSLITSQCRQMTANESRGSCDANAHMP